MKKYIDTFKAKSFFKNKKIRQVGVLYIAMGLNVLLGIGLSVINTRLLGPAHYGELKFLQTLFRFFSVFMTLGIFVTGGRLLALKKYDEIQQQLIGSLFLIASFVSTLLIVIIFFFSFFQDSIFNNNLGNVIRIFSPLLFVFPFQVCLAKAMAGSNRIYELSAFQIGPGLLYVVGAMVFNYFVPLSVTSALAIQLCGLSIVIAFFVFYFKPEFKQVVPNMSKIWQANKTHGLQSYIGMIAGVATGHLGGLSLAYYIDTTTVGIFSLAIAITMPLAMVPQVVATTYYKDFANSSILPLKVTILTVSVTCVALFVYLLSIEKVVMFLYSVEYGAVVPIACIVAIGSSLVGLGDYLNRFLGAHGKGRFNRNGALVSGVVNVLGYIILIKFFGIQGAAITQIVSGMIYALMMLYYYKKLKKELMSSKSKGSFVAI